ncbi:unnamed protein product [Calicophoron daubneyi]|uniref:Uncharacterized protein n=1 Tax=Calicophoron daubneyi TaxID=300641 RepID=A0AAV2TMK4_CALDB
MNEAISKTIEKLHEAGVNLRDTRLFHKVDDGDQESVLDREKRLIEERKQFIAKKREEAIKKWKEKGFPTLRPRFDNKEDYITKCEPKNGPEVYKQKLMTKDPDKPQNQNPYDVRSYRGDHKHAPPETFGTKIPVNRELSSDIAIRAKIRADILSKDRTERERQPISDVFPTLNAKTTGLTEEQERSARKYLLTSVYQDTYKNPLKKGEEICRRIFPITTLESLPDPLRTILGKPTHYLPTSAWKPACLDPQIFESSLPRFDYFNESRPYEFCSHSPRIEQIPTYSGSHGTRSRRTADDDPYKPYVPLTKLRTDTPKFAMGNPQQNIPGYTGCVVDHVTGTTRDYATICGDREDPEDSAITVPKISAEVVSN